MYGSRESRGYTISHFVQNFQSWSTYMLLNPYECSALINFSTSKLGRTRPESRRLYLRNPAFKAPRSLTTDPARNPNTPRRYSMVTAMIPPPASRIRSPPSEPAAAPATYLRSTWQWANIPYRTFQWVLTLPRVSRQRQAFSLWGLQDQKQTHCEGMRCQFHWKAHNWETYFKNKQSSFCGGVALLLSPLNGLFGSVPNPAVRHTAGCSFASCIPSTGTGGLGAWKRRLPIHVVC